VNPIDAAAGRLDRRIGEIDGRSERLGRESRPAAEGAEAEVEAERDAVGQQLR